MVFYIEACESGSMFPKLREDQHVYALTASNATKPSYAAYCSPEDTVNGVEIGSCLGDLFSINWMEDTESNNPYTETLDMQRETVIERTSYSPVMSFGDYSFTSEPIADFEGDASEFVKKALKATKEPTGSKSVVSSRDVKLHYLQKKQQRNGGEDAHEALQEELRHRKRSD